MSQLKPLLTLYHMKGTGKFKNRFQHWEMFSNQHLLTISGTGPSDISALPSAFGCGSGCLIGPDVIMVSGTISSPSIQKKLYTHTRNGPFDFSCPFGFFHIIIQQRVAGLMKLGICAVYWCHLTAFLRVDVPTFWIGYILMPAFMTIEIPGIW